MKITGGIINAQRRPLTPFSDKKKTTTDTSSIAEFSDMMREQQSLFAQIAREAAEQNKAKDEGKSKGSVEATRINDVMEGLNKLELVQKFQDTKEESKRKMLDITIDALAQQASMQDVYAVLRYSFGDSVEIDLNTVQILLSKTTEVKYLETLLQAYRVSQPVKSEILRQYAVRQFGPEPLKIPPLKLGDVNVTVDGKQQVTRGSKVKSTRSGSFQGGGSLLGIGAFRS